MPVAHLSLSARMAAANLHVRSAKATFARAALQLEADLINDVVAVSTSALAVLPPPPPHDTVTAPLWPPPLTPPFPPTSAHHAAAHACMIAFPSSAGGYECVHFKSPLQTATTAAVRPPAGTALVLWSAGAPSSCKQDMQSDRQHPQHMHLRLCMCTVAAPRHRCASRSRSSPNRQP